MIKLLARFKVYTDRARWYMGFFQMMITIAIYFRVKGIVLGIPELAGILILSVMLFILVGFIDVKLFKALKAEQKIIAEENPVLMEILERLKRDKTS
jgi:hypothetical protein